MSHEPRARTKLKDDDERESQISKQLIFYLVCVAVGGGLLSLAGMSLLNVAVASLTGGVVCIVWGIDRIYSDIQEMYMKTEKLTVHDLHPKLEDIRSD